MSNPQVIGAVIGALAAVVTSLMVNWFNRPRTKGEGAKLNAAALVTKSSDNREWAERFVQQADAALARAQKAEERADAAEERADAAEGRAVHAETEVGRCNERVDELEALLIEAWGYIRGERVKMVAAGLTPERLPIRLERFWASHH